MGFIIGLGSGALILWGLVLHFEFLGITLTGLLYILPALILAWLVAGCPTWAERPFGPDSRE